MISKKLAVLLAGVVVCSATAFGQLSINWIDNSGVTQSDGTTPWLDGGATGIAQLIFTASGVISPASTTGPTGDNVIWDTASFTEASTGNPYGSTFSALYSNPIYTAGQVFIRVFEADASPTTVGTWYYDGVLDVVEDGPNPPQITDMGPLSGGTGAFGTWQLDQQVIPEPSVFAMLGLGGLLLTIRRRFVA